MIYWLVIYTVIMIITLFFWLWYLSDEQDKLYKEDYMILVCVVVFSPIILPPLLLFHMALILRDFINLIFFKMCKWRKKNNDR